MQAYILRYAPLVRRLFECFSYNNRGNSKLDTVDSQSWRSVGHSRSAKAATVAKPAAQYLAAPASSAGVERVFYAAGKMHSDLQKSAKDSTLEHSLFAAFNTD